MHVDPGKSLSPPLIIYCMKYILINLENSASLTPLTPDDLKPVVIQLIQIHQGVSLQLIEVASPIIPHVFSLHEQVVKA